MDNTILEILTETYKWIAIAATYVFLLKVVIFFVTFQSKENILQTKEEHEENEYLYNNYAQSILAFLTAFGWYGYSALSHFTEGMVLSFCIVASVVTGIIAFAVSELLINTVKRQYRILSFDKKNLENRTAKALQNIRPGAKGSIRVDFEQDSVEYNMSENNTDFEIFKDDIVKIEKYDNGIIYISK